MPITTNAITVATSAALSALCDYDLSVAQLAGAAHRAFQDGRGSGVDVATACNGGLVRFTRGGPGKAGTWPDSLDVRILWSGTVADTGERIASLGDESGSGTAKALARSARDVDDALCTGTADSVLGVLREYVDALSAFDLDHQLGIFEAGHRQLADYARSAGDVVYKPCGAGGGDIGMAISASSSALDEFIRYAGQMQFSTIDAVLDEQGVLVEVA